MFSAVDPHSNTPIAVAFSGGSDSLALLLKVHSHANVTALYVNHHLRPEQELSTEIALNKSNCQRLGVPLEILDLDTIRLRELSRMMGMEGAARTLRYELLLSWCALHGATLLVAHTKDDQRENVLLRMLEGSPVNHLAIAPTREVKGIPLFRPLVGSTHEELRLLLRREGFVWSEDSTNTDCAIKRNHVRHELLPSLASMYPELGQLLDEIASFSLRLRTFIEGELAGVDVTKPLSRTRFLSLVPFARNEMIYRYLGCKDRVSSRFVDHIRSLLEGGSSCWSEQYGPISLHFEQGELSCSKTCEPVHFCYDGPVLTEGGTVSIAHFGTLLVRRERKGDDPKWIRLDPDSLSCPIVRSACEGDRIELEGRMVSVAHILSGWKIHRPLSEIAVLEDRGGIVALFGSRAGGRERISTARKSLAPRNLFVYYWC